MRFETSFRPSMPEAVVDASALIDLLLGEALGEAVAARLAGHQLHVPAHTDAEALSALARLHRAGELDADAVETMLAYLAAAPLERHPVSELLPGAWARRQRLRLADALYVELAASLSLRLVTTDSRLGSLPLVDVVER
ncbi:MAG: type II toxin-antitoxin system VapC family toxin [Candidatus Dormibacter sp.]|uniref:type II toxin-antitoxin system VapC family toxin n=1 Tax=Candidatus Dormibacter sp. TaxID=2973982 RepID=UPI003D9ACAC3